MVRLLWSRCAKRARVAFQDRENPFEASPSAWEAASLDRRLGGCAPEAFANLQRDGYWTAVLDEDADGRASNEGIDRDLIFARQKPSRSNRSAQMIEP